MNSLQKAIRESVIEPMLREIYHGVKATVLAYNNKTNVAHIEFDDPFGAGTRVVKSVPVQIGSGGTHSAGPFRGDEVWVQFLGGNPLRPRVVALADEDYYNKTRGERFKHERQGVMIPNRQSADRSKWKP